jgi:hypothetical protein
MNHHAMPIDENGDTASALMVSGGRRVQRTPRGYDLIQGATDMNVIPINRCGG